MASSSSSLPSSHGNPGRGLLTITVNSSTSGSEFFLKHVGAAHVPHEGPPPHDSAEDKASRMLLQRHISIVVNKALLQLDLTFKSDQTFECNQGQILLNFTFLGWRLSTDNFMDIVHDNIHEAIFLRGDDPGRYLYVFSTTMRLGVEEDIEDGGDPHGAGTASIESIDLHVKAVVLHATNLQEGCASIQYNLRQGLPPPPPDYSDAVGAHLRADPKLRPAKKTKFLTLKNVRDDNAALLEAHDTAFVATTFNSVFGAPTQLSIGSPITHIQCSDSSVIFLTLSPMSDPRRTAGHPLATEAWENLLGSIPVPPKADICGGVVTAVGTFLDLNDQDFDNFRCGAGIVDTTSGQMVSSFVSGGGGGNPFVVAITVKSPVVRVSAIVLPIVTSEHSLDGAVATTTRFLQQFPFPVPRQSVCVLSAHLVRCIARPGYLMDHKFGEAYLLAEHLPANPPLRFDGTISPLFPMEHRRRLFSATYGNGEFGHFDLAKRGGRRVQLLSFQSSGFLIWIDTSSWPSS